MEECVIYRCEFNKSDGDWACRLGLDSDDNDGKTQIAAQAVAYHEHKRAEHSNGTVYSQYTTLLPFEL